MKHFILFMAGIAASVITYGQTVNFAYDDSGNRISRTTIVLKSTSGATNESNSNEPFLDRMGDHSIFIYPNPVESELNVEIEGLEDNSDASISIIDQGGRLILHEDNLGRSNTINLSHLPSK
jgi:YD repeat-containing protein